MPETFNLADPAAKLQKLRADSVNRTRVNRFPAPHRKWKINRRPSLFSQLCVGHTLIFSFFELRQVAPFPGRETVVTEWISIFNPIGAYGSYLLYIRKSCFPPTNHSACYLPLCLTSREDYASRGMLNFAFPISSTSRWWGAIIKHESNLAEFDRVAYLSFLSRIGCRPQLFRR